MKKYLILVLFTVFTFILASCGGGNVCRVCEDKDVDGFCDVCAGPSASGGGGVSDVLLIEDGTATSHTAFVYRGISVERAHTMLLGVEHPSSRKNLNITRPPCEIKIINNEGGYVYVVRDTSKYGLSDGGYYDDVESFGGFFGDTKFIYGNAEDEYTVGTKEKLNIKNFRFE
jgi:hypothetical protein